MKKYICLYNNTTENNNNFKFEFAGNKRNGFKETDLYICVVKKVENDGTESYYKGFTFNILSEIEPEFKDKIAYDYTGLELVIRFADGVAMDFVTFKNTYQKKN